MGVRECGDSVYRHKTSLLYLFHVTQGKKLALSNAYHIYYMFSIRNVRIVQAFHRYSQQFVASDSKASSTPPKTCIKVPSDAMDTA